MIGKIRILGPLVVVFTFACAGPRSAGSDVATPSPRCQINQSPALAIAVTLVDTIKKISADMDTRRRHLSPTVTEEVVRHFMRDYARCVADVAPAADRAVSRITRPIDRAAGIAQSVTGNPAFTTQADRRAEVDRRFDFADTLIATIPDDLWVDPTATSPSRHWPRRPTITGRDLQVAIEQEARRANAVLGASIPQAITTSALTFATVLHDELEAFLAGRRTEREVAERLLIALRNANLRAVDDDVRTAPPSQSSGAEDGF